MSLLASLLIYLVRFVLSCISLVMSLSCYVYVYVCVVMFFRALCVVRVFRYCVLQCVMPVCVCRLCMSFVSCVFVCVLFRVGARYVGRSACRHFACYLWMCVRGFVRCVSVLVLVSACLYVVICACVVRGFVR